MPDFVKSLLNVSGNQNGPLPLTEGMLADIVYKERGGFHVFMFSKSILEGREYVHGG